MLSPELRASPTYCLQQRTIDELEGGLVFVHTVLMAAVCVCMCVW